MTRARRGPGWVPAYAAALTLLVAAPLLRPGHLLWRDAVSTPRSYLTDAALGLAEAAPRAVPQDFAVAAASRLLDGGTVVKALLLAGLLAAGVGAARLARLVVPEAGRPGEFVAVTLAIWNPYVAERLLQGHWSLLVGYGCLPWVATAMLRLRMSARPDRAGWVPLVFWIAAAGLTPTGLLLAVTVALVAVAAPGPGRPRWLCAAAASAAAVAAAAPWLLASVLGPGVPAATAAAGVGAFAARAEPGLGTLGSLAGLGGIWNADAVPGSRTSPLAVAATVVLVGLLAVGLPVAARRPAARPLLVLAAVAVLLPAAAATGAGQAVLAAVLDAGPGLGLLRDGQKWVALALPGYLLAAAGATVTLRRRLPAPAAAAACCAALIVVLPDLAWGVAGALRPVAYPPGWPAVAALINADPRPVAVVPPDPMRRFTWAGPAPVLDPLPRWVHAEVLSTGDLRVSGRIVPGEGAHARAVQQLLDTGADPAELAGAGVGWVVVETGDPGSAAATLAQLPPDYRDDELALYRVGGDAPGAPAAHRRTVIAAHLLWLALLGGGAAALPLPRWRRWRDARAA